MKSSKRKRESAPPAATPEAAATTPSAVKAAEKVVKAAPIVVLASHCSVKDAAALKASLAAAIDHREPVTVDAGAVERIDTATMQLLCAFARDRRAASRAVVWAGESKALREAAKLLGSGPMLALPETGAAA